jgi:hypothetical protein
MHMAPFLVVSSTLLKKLMADTASMKLASTTSVCSLGISYLSVTIM